MENVPALACLRDVLQGQYAEMGWKTPSAGSVAEPRHCIKCLAIAHTPSPMVGINEDLTRSFEKCVRPQKRQFPRQTRARSLISGRFISSSWLLTPLQKEMSNAQEKHSCRGKRLDRRSRHRRDEALPLGAGRKWQEAGHGAHIAVDGCHHSDGADSTVEGQTSI